MKKLILLAVVYLAANATASAALYFYNFDSGLENNGNIPDGNTSPWTDTRTVSGITEPAIESVTVRLALSGGYNGDLYCYLSYNGNRLILLNRVGVGTGSEPTFSFGYSGAGFTSLVLEDGASDIHTYGGGVGTGTYSADGRDVSPLSDPATLYGTSRDTAGAKFDGMNPNGDWSLVFADMSGGGGQSQVLGWGLDLAVAPEPVTVALGIFAAFLLLFHAGRKIADKSSCR